VGYNEGSKKCMQTFSKNLRVETAWDVSINGRIVLNLILQKQYVRVWTGFNWLRIRSNFVLLLTRY